jgi:Flp pilus assembly protein TadG
MAHIEKAQAEAYCGGNVAIEYGLILPVLILFTVGMMDTGRLLWTFTTLSRATAAAARCAAVNDAVCGAAGDIKTYAVKQAWGVQVESSAFAITHPACGVQVSVDYTFEFIVPWIGPSTPLTASACYPPQYP